MLKYIGIIYQRWSEEDIKQTFNNFSKRYNYLSIEERLEYYSFFGGIDFGFDIDFFDNMDDLLSRFLSNIDIYRDVISPSYILESPYRDILIAVARGDGRLSNIFKRARYSESIGRELISQLEDIGILRLEYSRESPLKIYPKQKIKKSLRSYRIESKARFLSPFISFWFGFVEPYRSDIYNNKRENFIQNYKRHYDRAVSLVFEELSNELIEVYYKDIDPIVSKGGFWDHHSEFDLLCLTHSGKVILGECKYRGKKICKNELNKLKEKAINSKIKVDIFALFSKNGFSNELKHSTDNNLLLFESKDFKKLEL